MSEYVTLWRTHEMVVASDESIGRPEWHEERVADESYAYPDAEYVAVPRAAFDALLEAKRGSFLEAREAVMALLNASGPKNTIRHRALVDAWNAIGPKGGV